MRAISVRKAQRFGNCNATVGQYIVFAGASLAQLFNSSFDCDVGATVLCYNKQLR